MNRSVPVGKTAKLCLSFVALTMIVGCFAMPPIVTAGWKVASGQMNTLTAQEVLALQELVAPELDLSLEQAEVISDVLAALGAGTIEEIQVQVEQIVAEAEADPDAATQILDELGVTEEDLELFIDLFEDFDVSLLEDITDDL